MACYTATVSCPNTGVLDMVFGYANPTGTQAGTIVLMSGSGGTQPSDGIGNEDLYAATYLSDNYQVVELAWKLDWEDTNYGKNVPLGGYPYSISTAACRPATFLWWVYNNIYINNPNDQRGYCAQGVSAGSTQIAYPMAWYGGGGSAFPLDKVELLSGPVYSDVKQGCQLPPATPVTVCPSGANYCNPDTSWQISPEYVYGPDRQVGIYSGDSNCAYGPQQYTSPAENQAWKAMSIIDGTNGHFSFPKTTISGWLCESVFLPQGQQCDQTSKYCMNNSSSQGQLFYSQVAAAGTTLPFKIYPVTTCDTAEGVSGNDAQVPAFNNENGFTAISNDMATNSSQTGQCKKNSIR